MKIRKGFVSNSSTTSFAIYGFCAQVNKLISEEQLGVDVEEDVEDWAVCDKIEEILRDKTNNTSLNYYSDLEEGYEYGRTYIGRDLDTIEDDETGKQLKDKTQKEIEEVFGKGFKCKTIVDYIGC